MKSGQVLAVTTIVFYSILQSLIPILGWNPCDGKGLEFKRNLNIAGIAATESSVSVPSLSWKEKKGFEGASTSEMLWWGTGKAKNLEFEKFEKHIPGTTPCWQHIFVSFPTMCILPWLDNQQTHVMCSQAIQKLRSNTHVVCSRAIRKQRSNTHVIC